MASEAIKAIKTVKSFANEQKEEKLYEEKLQELYETAKKGFITEPLLRGVNGVNRSNEGNSEIVLVHVNY